MKDEMMQDLILRQLYEMPNHEGIVVPSLFEPPILLSNIFRIGGVMKGKGLVTAPNRRMGGWHMRLLDPGKAYCETAPGKR